MSLDRLKIRGRKPRILQKLPKTAEELHVEPIFDHEPSFHEIALEAMLRVEISNKEQAKKTSSKSGSPER